MGRERTPMQRIDLFGAAAAFETVRMPDGTEAAIPTEHAAVKIGRASCRERV